jgi:hypothetical protein
MRRLTPPGPKGNDKAAKLIRWFERYPRYHLRFIPASGSRVNLVKRWFGDITEKSIGPARSEVLVLDLIRLLRAKSTFRTRCR